MNDETTANPAGGDDTRPEEVASFGAETEAFDVDDNLTEPPGDGEGEGEEIDPNDDPDADDALAQVDYEGQLYEVPAKLKGALLRQADYTRKTMELAEHRRAVAADREQVDQVRALTADEIRVAARLHSISGELQDLAQHDWTSLDPHHPYTADLRATVGRLIEEQNLLHGRMAEHQHYKTAREQQEAARTRAETDQAMMREIQNWSPERRRVLDNFAVHHGISEGDLDHASPAELRLLSLAHFGAQQMERQRAANRGAYRPAAEIGGSAGSGPSDPSRMSMAQYRAWRAKQT